MSFSDFQDIQGPSQEDGVRTVSDHDSHVSVPNHHMSLVSS